MKPSVQLGRSPTDSMDDTSRPAGLHSLPLRLNRLRAAAAVLGLRPFDNSTQDGPVHLGYRTGGLRALKPATEAANE
jgi:hypothetical protein